MEENGGKIKKIVFNEVSFILAICAMVLSCFIFLTNQPQQNSEAILILREQLKNEQNNVANLAKAYQNDTQELKSEISNLKTWVNQLSENVAVLTTIIDERIPLKK